SAAGAVGACALVRAYEVDPIQMRLVFGHVEDELLLDQVEIGFAGEVDPLEKLVVLGNLDPYTRPLHDDVLIVVPAHEVIDVLTPDPVENLTGRRIDDSDLLGFDVVGVPDRRGEQPPGR